MRAYSLTAPLLLAVVASPWLVHGSSTQGATDARAVKSNPAATTTEVHKLFQSVDLPYNGAGSVLIFKPGIIHVTVGSGEVKRNAAGQLEKEATETISISFAHTRDLGLVSRQGAWTVMELDRERDLKDLSVIRFAENRDDGLQGIFQLAGNLQFRYDEKSQGWDIAVQDVKGENTFTFFYKPESWTGWDRTSAALLATCSSGPCTYGECSITCNPPFLCQAGCNLDGTPTCACVSPVPPQPRPFPPHFS